MYLVKFKYFDTPARRPHSAPRSPTTVEWLRLLSGVKERVEFIFGVCFEVRMRPLRRSTKRQLAPDHARNVTTIGPIRRRAGLLAQEN